MNIALPVLGGLGLFLYAVKLMGTGLQKVAGDKLKKLIEILTNNRLVGVLVGTVVTMIIQSSSITTVMVIGFVNAGLMSLTQAVGIIMGANIGTTITAQLIAFKVTDYAPLAVIFGVGIWLVARKKKLKDLAEILIGFGILFIGMDMMGDGIELLSNVPSFTKVLKTLSNPFIGMLVGLGMTTLVQSSSASIGVLQALAGQGLLDIYIAFPILFGDNIGTTTTALISSIGANKSAKRAAIIHFLFNVIGTIIFMTVLRLPVQSLVLKISPNDIERQIANAHTLFNLINVIIQLPFASLLVKAAEIIIPGVDSKEKVASKYLDFRIIETPSIAIGQVNKEVIRIGEFVQSNLKEVEGIFIDENYKSIEKSIESISEREKTIRKIKYEVTDYLIALSNGSLSEEEHTHIFLLFNLINDIQRVEEQIKNIIELSQNKLEQDLNFSEVAKEELHEMFKKCQDSFKYAMKAFEDNDLDYANYTDELELEVHILEKQAISNHIYRQNNNQCITQAGVIFLDAISNIVSISNHSNNISQHVIEKNRKVKDK